MQTIQGKGGRIVRHIWPLASGRFLKRVLVMMPKIRWHGPSSKENIFFGRYSNFETTTGMNKAQGRRVKGSFQARMFQVQLFHDSNTNNVQCTYKFKLSKVSALIQLSFSTAFSNTIATKFKTSSRHYYPYQISYSSSCRHTLPYNP